MQYRKLGKTGFEVSEVSLGTWQVGGVWGSEFDDTKAESILHAAIDQGVNFIDTADVYSDGKSEKAIGRVIRQRTERIYIATKCGRKINPHIPEGYQPNVLQKYVEDSLRRLGVETIDLIQLHCPPTAIYYRPEIFELFDRLKDQGKILNLGVSVEKVEEGLKAIEYSNVASVQIIFNMFRQRPADLFFKEAAKRNVGIIVRVPLASGLLTGKFDSTTEFGAGDHRQFNRNGAAFDKGETFAGVPYEKGLEAVEKLRKLFPENSNLAPLALKWILGFEEVSCVIPGASKVDHVKSNISTEERPPLSKEQIAGIEDIYTRHIKEYVHHLW